MCNSLLIQYLQIYSNYCTTYFHQLIFFFSRASYSFKLYKKRQLLSKPSFCWKNPYLTCFANSS
ncbi:hypothetical protein GEZ92_01425 [Streptococcus mitis]|nr:hypothetical protein [Streptococcus mitis]MQQ13054.1 hypothetical protein [Streptococcus mitis]MQQ46400.1 hypothetical protein [Streptococcus mitis]MQQ57186.1 hypothetical protein [Streptococcus mitis]MQQ59418.1 hypothetical protein [Streptococcus mitis]